MPHVLIFFSFPFTKDEISQCDLESFFYIAKHLDESRFDHKISLMWQKKKLKSSRGLEEFFYACQTMCELSK